MREEGVNEGGADFEEEIPSALPTAGDRRFSATSLEAVLIWSVRINKIAGDVVVDDRNNIFM